MVPVSHFLWFDEPEAKDSSFCKARQVSGPLKSGAEEILESLKGVRFSSNSRSHTLEGNAGLWLHRNPDVAAIDGRLAHRLFLAVCQFPAMRASWLHEVVGGSSGEVGRHLRRFVDIGLVAVFDGRHYLAERMCLWRRQLSRGPGTPRFPPLPGGYTT